jgi:hypothetical protein
VERGAKAVAERKQEKALAPGPGLYKRGRAARWRHVDSRASTKELLAAIAAPGSGRNDTDGELPATLLDLEKFTELPLTLFFKLLKNILKNFKISKYKSCSTFQILQLSQ